MAADKAWGWLMVSWGGVFGGSDEDGGEEVEEVGDRDDRKAEEMSRQQS